jgi:hypothetical protein
MGAKVDFRLPRVFDIVGHDSYNQRETRFYFNRLTENETELNPRFLSCKFACRFSVRRVTETCMK